ncbi:Glycosyltransferase AglJ [uncultured archaeon]|nr:Glycosyltransferase AglJ [uncultured archaeon]
MADKITVSVVMPSFNEEEAIGRMIESIRENTKDFETEILLVDSSKDRTPEIARQMGAKVIVQPPQGHGVALRTAISSASNDVIITSDCDNTYPMEYIPKLVDLAVNEGYDVVSCNRLTKELGKQMPFTNKVGNTLFATLVRVLYGVKVHDVSTGMFCLRRDAVNKMTWETNYSFPCELILKSARAGLKHKEIDIPYRIRIGEVTLNKWRSGKAYILCIFKYRFNLPINPKKL